MLCRLLMVLVFGVPASSWARRNAGKNMTHSNLSWPLPLTCDRLLVKGQPGLPLLHLVREVELRLCLHLSRVRTIPYDKPEL